MGYGRKQGRHIVLVTHLLSNIMHLQSIEFLLALCIEQRETGEVIVAIRRCYGGRTGRIAILYGCRLLIDHQDTAYLLLIRSILSEVEEKLMYLINITHMSQKQAKDLLHRLFYLQAQ